MNTFVLLVLFAPAPMPKPAPPSPAIKSGSYVMTWKGVDAQTIFHHDGFYSCQWQGQWWHGNWRQEKGQMRVEEWPMNEPHRRYNWTIKLSGPLAGEMEGGAWRLAPQSFGGGA